ncbi:hypothetical protein WMF27_20665 [Sorangium sp. So ce281]|uniref:hypothetical protein n=1 Tax=unclassified Sorangium TaxID=2621164 RepID=UPI003F63F5F4
MREDDFPLDLETFLGSTVEVLKHQGHEREIAIIVNAKPIIQLLEYDNWNGGIYTWGLSLESSAYFCSPVKAERQKSEEIIKEAGKELFADREDHSFAQVTLVPRRDNNPRWRQDADDYLRGKGVNNQGRVRSTNIPPHEHEGLFFRSPAEINLYQALKKLGVTFAPLPVFLRGGSNYKRIEPDFVIIKDGMMMVVEIDGKSFHQESPADAHERLRILDHEGAKIERVKAEQCSTLEKAKACADELLSILKKRLNQKT